MNSNGVGVLQFCFFTTIFFKAGKEVWNWRSSFCPQPFWMQMKSFMQKGLKPEQQPRCQNLKMTSRREKVFPWFQGKTQSMPLVCSSKKEIPPQTALNQECFKSCFVTPFARTRTHKALSEQSRGSTELRKNNWQKLDKKAVQRLCWTFSQNMNQQNPDAIRIKYKVFPQTFWLCLPDSRKTVLQISKALFFWCGGSFIYLYPPLRIREVKCRKSRFLIFF